MNPWDLPAGSLRTREEIAARFGGSLYSGGIVPSKTSPNIFLFTDPAEGTRYGYTFDGPSVDGSAFYYTGKGATGDQRLDEANGSVLAHVAAGRSLRLFEAVGLVPGTGTKIHKYLGEFMIDVADPYRLEAAPGKDGTRLVVVFRLLPLPGADFGSYQGPTPLEPATEPLAREVPPEVDSTHFFETGQRAAGMASRVESALVRRFIDWRGVNNVTRWAIRVPSDNVVLLTDVYDRSERVLYEAKASPRRSDVRMALGQLLDYRRHIGVDGLRTRLLVPERPSDDLVALARQNQVGVAFADESLGFTVED